MAIKQSESRVLVAMPVMNRSNILPMTLAALTQLEFLHDRLKMVFVDGYSTDGTWEILEAFRKERQHEFGSIILLQKKSNIPQARNICLESLGDADCVWFLDSDVVPQPNSLERLLTLLKKADIASLFYTGLSYQPPKLQVNYVHNVGMGCTLISRKVFEEVGVFDENLVVGEDTDFCLRAEEKGFKIILDTTVELNHLDRDRYKPWRMLKKSVIHRKVYAKIFMKGAYLRRFLLYTFLSIATYLAPFINPLFYVPIVAYFGLQLFRLRSPLLSVLFTINSIIIVPLTLVGLVERKLLIKHKIKPAS